MRVQAIGVFVSYVSDGQTFLGAGPPPQKKEKILAGHNGLL